MDILSALGDPNLTGEDKVAIFLGILFPGECPGDIPAAVKAGSWFIDGGQERKGNQGPRVMDWEQDFPLIISAINETAGREVRAEPGMHWWTFLSYYMAVGDCAFANIVSIRKKLAKGQRLEKHEREFYHYNRDMVDLKTKYTEAEKEFLLQITGG